ncbi:hypothetical protein B0H11DRAFT_1794540 [Mycena galericulata]|nr:hypothetical protein B0H11DRAFT_1794540 [Mycena galericulata]
MKQEILQTILRAEAAEKLSQSQALRIETLLQNITRLDAVILSHSQQRKELQQTLRATGMREKRAKTSLSAARKELKAMKSWSGMKKRTFTTKFRSLALAFTRSGTAQDRIGPLLTRVGKVFGIEIKRTMSRRTIGRIITEAGIKVRIQLGHELARAKALCLSSDGTSHRNIKYEARHITYDAPTYTTDPNEPATTFCTRVVDIDHALDHTAQSQYEGWDVSNQKILDAYINSPLGRRDALDGYGYEMDDLWRKMVAYNADHASDVRATARKCGERKRRVVESDMGLRELESMSDEEMADALWEVVEEMCDDPDGLDPSSLPDDIRTEALQSLAAHIGSKALDSLPEIQQNILTRIVVAGCCYHKDHNCTKSGVVGANAVWEILGLTPPVLLANKDNAATIALGEDADSEAVERALKASQRGAHKLISICGSLFRHKDDKKGHQDLHRHFFSKVKFDMTGEHSTVKFPDTSNNRYGSHNAGAAELISYHSAYLQFFSIIRDSKQTPGLNHSEQNALNALEDMATMTECAVMTLYKNAVSDGYLAATRKAGVNHIDLGPLHHQLISHIEKLAENPDLLLDPTAPSAEATVDGLPFRDQFAVDAVHFMASKLPHLEQILVAFLKATIPAWRRFSKEFEPGGIIDSLTPAEKLLMFIPPTNDANEGLLGGWRVYSRARSSGTIAHFSAQAAYHRNNTEAFSDAKLDTEEDALYIMRLARVEDASGAMRKFREELMEFKQRAAEASRKKQQDKIDEAAARIAELQAILVITDCEELANLKRDGLREQLDVRRELWKEEGISKKKLKDMKTKPQMLRAIIESDERRGASQ